MKFIPFKRFVQSRKGGGPGGKMQEKTRSMFLAFALQILNMTN